MIEGLSHADAARLRLEHGPNELARAPATPAWRLLAAQVASPVIVLLIVAAVISAALGAIADAIAIGAIVVINAITACGGLDQDARRALTERFEAWSRDGLRVLGVAAR